MNRDSMNPDAEPAAVPHVRIGLFVLGLALALGGPIVTGSGRAHATPATPARPATALLVLMENGGFTNGMPADAAIGVRLCGRFQIPSGTDLGALLASAAAGLETSASCLKRANWKPVTMPVTRYVAAITNQIIEDVGVGAIRARTATTYDRVVILQDGEVTIDRIRSTLTSLASRYTLDIHVLAHGSSRSVSFRNRPLTPLDIRSLSAIPNLRLRSVYQQNCYGSSLVDDWLAAGARAVNGSDRINYMPLSYLSFLKRWAGGQTFRGAVEGSTTDWVPYFRTVYRHVDLYDGRKVRLPPDVDLFGRLDPSEELTESRMAVSGPGADATA